MDNLTQLSESIESIPNDIKEGLLRAAQYGCSLEQLSAWYRIVWEHYGFADLPRAANTSLNFQVPAPDPASSYALGRPPYLQDHTFPGRKPVRASPDVAVPTLWTPPNSKVNASRGIAGPAFPDQPSTFIAAEYPFHQHTSPSAVPTNIPTWGFSGAEQSTATSEASPQVAGPISPSPYITQPETHPYRQPFLSPATNPGSQAMSNVVFHHPGISPSVRSNDQGSHLRAQPPQYPPAPVDAHPTNRLRPPNWTPAQGNSAARSSNSPSRVPQVRKGRSSRLPKHTSPSNPVTPPNPRRRRVRSLQPASQEQTGMVPSTPYYSSGTVWSSSGTSPCVDLAREQQVIDPFFQVVAQPGSVLQGNFSSGMLPPSSAPLTFDEQPFHFAVNFDVNDAEQ